MVLRNDSPLYELRSFSPGQDFGLSLIINIEQDYYMGYGLAQSEGVQVLLSEPYKLPNVLATQFSLGM